MWQGIAITHNAESKRSKNFSDREISLLLDILTSFINVIENKRTDNMSCRVKNAAWENIAIDYNNNIEQAPSRTVRQLKNCYENFKKKTRKELAEMKAHNGNNYPYKKMLSQNSQRLLNMISACRRSQEGECSRGNILQEETLFIVEDDSASYEPETSIKYEHSDDDERDYEEISPDYKVNISDIQINSQGSNQEIHSHRKFGDSNHSRRSTNCEDNSRRLQNVEISNEKNNSSMSSDENMIVSNVHSRSEFTEDELNHIKKCEKLVTAYKKLLPSQSRDVNISPAINIKSASDINSLISLKSLESEDGDLSILRKTNNAFISKESVENNSHSISRKESVDDSNNNNEENKLVGKSNEIPLKNCRSFKSNDETNSNNSEEYVLNKNSFSNCENIEKNACNKNSEISGKINSEENTENFTRNNRINFEENTMGNSRINSEQNINNFTRNSTTNSKDNFTRNNSEERVGTNTNVPEENVSRNNLEDNRNESEDDANNSYRNNSEIICDNRNKNKMYSINYRKNNSQEMVDKDSCTKSIFQEGIDSSLITPSEENIGNNNNKSVKVAKICAVNKSLNSCSEISMKRHKTLFEENNRNNFNRCYKENSCNYNNDVILKTSVSGSNRNKTTRNIQSYEDFLNNQNKTKHHPESLQDFYSSSLIVNDEDEENERASSHNHSYNKRNNHRIFNKSHFPISNILKRKYSVDAQNPSPIDLTQGDRMKMSEFYESMNEVLNLKKRKSTAEEMFLKRRREIMLEIEEINLRNAVMQSKILENNLRVSELEVRIKEKALEALEKSAQDS